MRFLLWLIVMIIAISTERAEALPFGYQYIYPLPNSERVAPQTTIIVRLDAQTPGHVAHFISVSDEHGVLAGISRPASDDRTIIFRPERPFERGATVNVTLSPPAELAEKFTFQFKITENPAIHSETVLQDEPKVLANNPANSARQAELMSSARIMPNGVSVPSDFPHINVTINSAPGDGYIFLNNRGQGTPFNIIFDNDGSPVWYLKTDDRRRDFKVQRNGTITMLARSGGHRFLNFDKNFKKLGEYSAVDGYETDEHECVITEDGHVLLIGNRGETVDMSRYVTGGRKNATVIETIIQEFTPEGDKIFEWRAWDHFGDVIQFLELEDLQGGTIRFPHMNAIDIDYDGHILLSSRHLSEVSKINRQTGEFIWRLGGPKNQFAFVNDELGIFKNQHAILSLGNNHYTLFDNGTSRFPNVSRGVEYELDVEKKTARLVWEYRNPPGTSYSHYMGNHQRLPNGNSLINWAVSDRPKATEVTPDGRVVYEMDWVSPDECYRAFRFPWDGVVAAPNLFVESAGDHIVLLFNKFGDKTVDYYNIYGGTAANPTTLIDTSKATLKGLYNLQNGRTYFFRVRAVLQDGSLSPFSPEESIYVNLKTPGANLVLNGDFSRTKRDWKHENYNSAQSTWTAVTREGHIQIQNPGIDRRSIVFYQGQMPMVKGKEYLFEFDAYANEARVMEVMVCQAGNPQKNYSRIGLVSLKNRKQSYSYVFTMNENTDYNAELRFHVGADEADVILDNVVLRENINVAVASSKTASPLDFKVLGNFPNPFNTSTIIHFQLASAARVKLEVFDILGRLQLTAFTSDLESGQHHIQVDASSLSSGLYLYRMTALIGTGEHLFSATQKMILIK